MASCFFISDDLLDHDVLGAIGCQLPAGRRNLLVETTIRQFSEDHIDLQTKQLSPEGFGYFRFGVDSMTVPGIDTLNEDVTIIWDVCQQMPPLNCRVWLLSVVVTDGWDFIFDGLSTWLHAEKPSRVGRPLHILELFAGGVGGWKMAGDFICQQFDQKWETVAVDSDIDVAKCYAITHSAHFVKDPAILTRDFLVDNQGHWILGMDVCNQQWFPTVAKWGVDAVVMSPPCPAWSGAVSAPGLSRWDGLLFAKALLLCRWFMPDIICIENVAGFNSHPHFKEVMHILRWLGYRLIFNKIVELADQSPTFRQRFLAVAIRVHSSVSTKPPDTWYRQDFLNHPMSCSMSFSLEEKRWLFPKEEVIAIARDSRFSRNPTSEQDALLMRIYKDGQCVPTFMAKYGQQHDFSKDFLIKFGYFGHFVQDQDSPCGFRFWHPAEIAIIHGIVKEFFIPQDCYLAWHILGNQIALPHALLLVGDIFKRLHHFDFSTFVVFEQLQQKRLLPHNAELRQCGGGFILKPSNVDSSIDPEGCRLLLQECQNPNFQCWWAKPIDVEQPHPQTDVMVEQISQCSPSPTLAFDIVVSGVLLSEPPMRFWCTADTPAKQLETLWLDFVQCHFHHEPDSMTPAIVIKHVSHQNPVAFEGVWRLLVILIDAQLTILFCQDLIPMADHPPLREFADTLFDQFGALGPRQTQGIHTLLMKRPMIVQPPAIGLHFLIGAFKLASFTVIWNAGTFTLSIRIDGTSEATALLLDFWGGLFPEEQLTNFGLTITKARAEGVGFVHFQPIEDKGNPPPMCFKLCLAVAATRQILNAIDQTGPKTQVRIMWQSRPLWAGLLPRDTTASLLHSLVQYGLFVLTQLDRISLVMLGRRVSHEWTIGQMHDPSKDEIVLHVVPSLSGGGPSKQQQRTVVKNAIAAVLLEQGSDLTWVKKAVDTLTEKLGLPRLQQAVSHANPSNRIKDIQVMCQEVGLQFPSPTIPTNQVALASAPWNKAKKRREEGLNPGDFKVDEPFFINGDKQRAPQIQQIRANATGFCLVLPHEAAPWIRANQIISPDELGAIVLGRLPCDTTLNHEEVTMPCTNINGQAVLLSGTLVQLGSKKLCFAKGDPKQVDAETGHLMSITLYQPDWSEEDWKDITTNPFTFIGKVLDADSLREGVQSMWGKSLRNGRAAASPSQASTVQVHCTVTESKRDTILKASGLNNLYFTPKCRTGRIDQNFKIIWTQGDLAKAVGLVTQTPHCLGLVRGKDTYGLRFTSDKFQEAWALLCPGKPAPPTSTGEMTYKIEGLPFGCTAAMMKEWSSKVGWPITPFKALGPNAWLVKTDQAVPGGLLHFNTSPLLVRFLPPRDVASTPLLVGPWPKSNPTSTAAPGNLAVDPWAQWQGPRPSPSTMTPTRAVEGPMTAKFKEQDEKIASLQSEIKKLSVHTDQQLQAVDQRLTDSDKNQTKQFAKVEASIAAINTNIDQALQQSVQQNASLMEQKMKELRDLFVGTKRGRPDGDVSME